MKIIKVPYGKKVQKVISFGIVTLALCGFCMMLISIMKLDWFRFFLGAVIAVPTSVFLWKIMTFKIVIQTKEYDFDRVKFITDVNEQGFVLKYATIGNIEITEDKEIGVQWLDVVDIDLEEGNRLIVNLSSKEQISIDRTYTGWYSLVKQIPKSKFKTPSMAEVIHQMFDVLNFCKICGDKAVDSEKCLSCSNRVFDDEIQMIFESESDYIKAEQLEWFSTSGEDECVIFYESGANVFKRDENWTPMVTEEEVIEYSRVNNWV